MVDEREHSRDWTDAELRACVVAYREMQLAIQAGERVNKTTKRNEVLATALQGRSAGSYEYRMANIATVVEDLGLPILPGYTPRRNVGARVTAKLVAMINEIWDREHAPEIPTAEPDELQTRVQSARKKFRAGSLTTLPVRTEAAGQAETTGWRFVRDPNVIAWVTWNAGGVCEACDTPAPFTREDGEPYLEVHHVRPLAEGGPDSIDNAVAACPTCHRRFHHGADKDGYRRATIKKVARLVDHPPRGGRTLDTHHSQGFQ